MQVGYISQKYTLNDYTLAQKSLVMVATSLVVEASSLVMVATSLVMLPTSLVMLASSLVICGDLLGDGGHHNVTLMLCGGS